MNQDVDEEIQLRNGPNYPLHDACNEMEVALDMEYPGEDMSVVSNDSDEDNDSSDYGNFLFTYNCVFYL